jgi:hypothetical protein
MSRNIGRKTEARKGKKSPSKRSNKSDYSSDDDYAGVDLITDSEEEEPDVEVAEEQAIIDSEEELDDGLLPIPQPSVDDDQSSWGGFDLDEQFMGEGQHFNEQISRMENQDWNTTEDETLTRRPSKVHFEDSDSDSGLSDPEDDTIFPDIFLDQSSLDPNFRRVIENDNDEDEGGASSDDGSYWDFQGSDGHQPEGSDHEEDKKSESSFGSSGYESKCIGQVQMDTTVQKMLT